MVIVKGYNITGSQNFDFPINFCMGPTAVPVIIAMAEFVMQTRLRYSAACLQSI